MKFVLIGMALCILMFVGCADFDPYAPTRPILFSSDRSGFVQIFSLNQDLSVVNLTQNPTKNHWFPCWSPDGKHIAFIESGSEEIFVMDADGSNQRQITADGKPKYGLSWDSKGTQIVYSRLDGRHNLYKVPVSGGPETPLVFDPGSEDMQPSVGPDGRIVWAKAVGGLVTDLWVSDSDGGNAEAITSTPWDEWNPSWSPNGRAIAFWSPGPIGPNIQVITPGDASSRNLTSDSMGNYFPSWSEDGTRIVFLRGPGSDLWTIEPNGDNLNPLLVDPWFNYEVAW